MTESSSSHSDHDEIVAHVGPLASLAGTWEADQGIDISHFNQNARRPISGNASPSHPLALWVTGTHSLWDSIFHCGLAAVIQE